MGNSYYGKTWGPGQFNPREAYLNLNTASSSLAAAGNALTHALSGALAVSPTGTSGAGSMDKAQVITVSGAYSTATGSFGK